jgi:tetratricopeptide (TPR) repeat protein
MHVDEILKDIRSKDVHGKLSDADVEVLFELVKQYPCDLPTLLLLLELAQLHTKIFPKSWVTYFKESIAIADKCWTPEELAQIYRFAAKLYSFDQDIDSQIEAATKAFNLYPNDWHNISAYIWYNKKLSEDDVIPLISRISDLAPGDALALYSQGSHFERCANSFEKEQYKEAAIKAYQRSLELGLNKEKHDVPSIAAENAIERLRKS